MGVSVAQALKIGGLNEGHLLTGARALGNIIEYVNIIEAPLEPIWYIQNTLFITSFYAIKDSITSQLETIDLLAGQGCAALVFQTGILNELPAQVIQRAELLGLPIIEVSEAVSYAKIIQPLVGAILQEKTALLQRSEEIHRRLTDLSLSGAGLEAIARALNEILNRPIAILDVWGCLIAASGLEASANRIKNRLQDPVLPVLPETDPIYDPVEGLWWIKLFSGPGHESDGMILVEDPAREMDEMDLVALEQGAIIAAVEVTKQRAVLEVEHRLQQNLMESLIGENQPSEAAILARAHSLGWDLRDKHVVAIFDLGVLEKSHSQPNTHPHEAPSNNIKTHFFDAVLDLLKTHNPDGIAALQGDMLILLPGCPTMPAAQRRRELQLLAEKICALGMVWQKGKSVFMAFGRFTDSLQGLRSSYEEALSALTACQKLAFDQPIIWYDDVALYVLLERIAAQPETMHWFEKTLGRLVEYDRTNGADLVRTLEAYFDSNQMLQKAAYSLFVHPKTLKYRLQRITEILGSDPFVPNQQLNYYLAVKLARLFAFSEKR